MLSIIKSDKLATKLNDELERIDINRLARLSGFVRREPRKIKPLHFYFSPFRKNDQSAADDIVSRLQPGDLILRDLGFFVLAVFRLISQAKAFFISPLKYGVKLYELDGKTEIDLVRELKKSRFLDIDVLPA